MNVKRILLILISIFLLITATCFANETIVVRASLNTHKIVLTEGRRASLKVSYAYCGSKEDIEIDWDSDNDKIATVSNGYIEAINEGKTEIKVIVDDKEDYCEVVVNPDHPHFTNTKQCYTELNKYRKKGKLKKDIKLEKVAKIRAKELATSGKFSHTRPNGKSGLTLVKGHKVKGENIAKGQKTPKEVTKAWYKSKGHRANMLRKKFKKVGIAAYTYRGTTYWVQIYSS